MDHKDHKQMIGQRIRWLRQGRRLSQKALAGQLGVCQQLIVRYEQGLVDLPISRLLSLATIFGCPLDDLLTKKETTYDAFLPHP